METLWKDLRFGLRQLAAEKAFSFAAILTLTLGIGATATIWTVVDAVLLKELPYENPERLVILRGTFEDRGEVKPWQISQMDFADWRERSTVFSQMAVWGVRTFNLEQGQESLRLSGELVNDEYFPLLGLRPTVGRFFGPEEDARPMEDFVIVLSHDLWQRAFDADPGVVGRKLQMNSRTFEVIGVGPPGFRGLSDEAELWMPSMLPQVPIYLTVRSLRWASGVARLKPGVTLPQAQEQLGGVTAALARELPDTNQGYGAEVVPLKDFWFGTLRDGLVFSTLGAGILLLIACINVGSLLLTRVAAKQRAWAIRIALGARRGRLIRQLLTESLLLSLIGAAAGLLLARWATRALIAVSGTELPSFVKVGAEPDVIAAILGLAVLCGLVFGLVPIVSSFRTSLTQSLGRDEKLEPPGRGWRLFQGAVVISQVALALTLSISALLMADDFRRKINEDLGFRAENLLTYRMDVRSPMYFDVNLATRLLRQDYLPRIEAIPGVERVALSVPTIPTDPWSGANITGANITVEEHPSDLPDGTFPAVVQAVSPGYFEILGIPIVKGRAFDSQDTETNAVIVSQAMADQHWPGRDPIGKRLLIGALNREETPWLTVVGVSAPVRIEGFGEEKPAAPVMYLSLLQYVRRPFTVNFLVRPQPGVTTAELREPLHREMRAINPEIPDYDVATMEERLAKQTGKARFLVILISVFAGLALVLAAIGIYGVISYSVTRRTREIAIRMSLGADRGRVLRLVVGRGAVLGVLGLGLGLAAVFALSRLLAGLLDHTSTFDPVILGSTSLGLFLVTLAANYLPARRAAVLEPMVVLRFQ